MRVVGRSRSTSRAFTLAALLLLLFLTPAASMASELRFRSAGRLAQSSADWVTADEKRIVFGSGSRVVVARAGEPPAFDFEIELTEPALQGVFAGERLYLNDGAALRVLDFADLERGPVPVDLLSFGRSLHIARMDDYLLVAEDGFGLRILLLPPPPGHKMPGHEMPLGSLPVVAELPLAETFAAVDSSIRKAYLVTADGRLIVVDARRPDAPVLERSLALAQPAHAVAANGPRVWLLGEEGLRILDLSSTETDTIERFPSVSGKAIELSGRAVYVAASQAGMASFRDLQRGTTTHFVTVSSNTFSPSSLTIDIGDTVQWDNIGGIHNVESCDGVSDPVNCVGQVAAEGAFTSGPAASAPWTYSKIFNVVGSNRYFCVVHVNLGMVGTITVQAPLVADHFVTVATAVFSPASLTVNPGDVVQWDNVGGTHNVESCDNVSDPAQCGGSVAAEGLFELPGGPTGLPWTFQHAFTVPGSNRYFCVIHVPVGMIGTVSTSAPDPPGVPASGPPVLVDKQNPSGTELSVSFDTATCSGNTDHQIIFGFGSGLPATLAGTYDPTGGACAIGAGSPFTWTPVPDPVADPSRFLWFLVLANDGATTEGSWGQNSSVERTGPGLNGSSGECAVTDKSLSNTCGQ